MRVLVVDDEAAIRSCIVAFLRTQGFEVSEANDGVSALRIAKKEGRSIAAVLTDVHMPGMNGIEMWKHMRPLVTPDCKIVFMSGLAQGDLLKDVGAPGDLLEKPFPFSILREKFGAPTL